MFFELVSILSGVIFSSLALFSFHYIIVLTSILLGLIILVIPKFFDDKISDEINNVSEEYKELQSNSFNMINVSISKKTRQVNRGNQSLRGRYRSIF